MSIFRQNIYALLSGTFLMIAAGSAMAQKIPDTVDDKVTIRFYNYNLASAGMGRDATVEMIDSFRAANPNITVEGVPVPSPEMISRIQADVVAGLAPDIVQVVFSDLSYIMENFGISPLEDLVSSEELGAHFDGIIPAGLELGRIDGKTYGLAYVFSTPVLFYNADMFRAAGLDPDASLAIWDDVSAAARTITEKTGKTGFLSGVFKAGFDWLLQGLVLSSGGRVLSEDRKTLTFAEPEAMEAIAMLRGLAQAGAYKDMPGGAAIEQMVSGGGGMFLGTSAVQASLLRGAKGNFELRAAPMPAFGDKPARPTNSGSALVIMARDPVKQRAAWELMKHLTSDYAYNIITAKIGYVPLRTTTIEGEEFLAPWLRENPLAKINIDQLSHMSPWVPIPGPNYKQIASLILSAGEQAVFGQGDPQQVMSDAQRRAQALMPN